MLASNGGIAVNLKSLANGPSAVFLTWLILLTLLPFLVILGISFLEKSQYGTLEFSFTLTNYARLFQFVYMKVFLRTLFLALSATLFTLLIGFPVAYYLAKSQGYYRQIGLILLFVPFWTNFILRIHGLVSLFGNHGLLNQLLLDLGTISEPLSILYTRTGVYIGLIYNYLPFLVVPIFSSLEKFDASLREASLDLGASRGQTFWKVLIPNIRGGCLVGCLFVFIPMLGEYVIPDLLGGAKEAFLGNIMVSQFYTMQDWPFGSAIAGLMSFLLLIALWVRTRWEKAR